MASNDILGLIAGQGRLPFLVADGAKRAGLKVVCVGLNDNADPGLAKYVDVFFSGVITRPGRWMRRLRKYGASRTVMVGRVAKSRMYTPWRIRNETVLCAIADELASGQIYLENSTMYCKEHLADEGVMTKCRPGASAQGDIEFGWPILQKLTQLDIGQAIAVKEKEIIAVEAIEGTAEMIERAGQLCKKGGWTLIKGTKANKDMRFDVPCVGPDTIESLAKNGARCLVVQKEKTIIIDKPETIELADKAGIAIVGY